MPVHSDVSIGVPLNVSVSCYLSNEKALLYHVIVFLYFFDVKIVLCYVKLL